jgi:hypothetical protein
MRAFSPAARAERGELQSQDFSEEEYGNYERRKKGTGARGNVMLTFANPQNDNRRVYRTLARATSAFDLCVGEPLEES